MVDIFEFFGQYRFLSNFYLCDFEWQGDFWPSTEHAFQAAKTLDRDEQLAILTAPTPAVAKRLGRTVTLRDDWEQVKVDIMYDIVEAKFEQNSLLRQQLLETGNGVLEEGNTWGDNIWGVCPPRSGKGRNELGKILVKLRNQFKHFE